MSFGAPDKEHRIAAHRSPGRFERIRQSLALIELVWRHNRRLFWIMAFTLGGVSAILAAMVTLVVMAVF